MTKVQRLMLDLAAARKRADKILGDKKPSDLSAEDRAQWESAQLEVGSLQSAIQIEQGNEDLDGTGEHIEASQGETAEIRALVGRSNLHGFISPIAQGQNPEGAERELQQAQNLDVNQIPWELLAGAAPRRIQGADAAAAAPTTGLPTNQNPIIARVFARTAAAYLGVMFPSVPVGQSSYPVLTGGATGSVVAKGAGKDAEAPSWSVKTLGPTRLTARYLVRIEDLYSFAGMEEALRMDLTDVLGDALDKVILQGDGTAPNPAGFFDGDSGITIPSAATSEADEDAYLGAVMAAVDGKHCHEPMDVRLLIGGETLQHMGTKFITGTSDTVYDKIKSVAGGVRVSFHVPGKASSAQFALLSCMEGRAVAPMWRAPSVIRDEVTGAAKGEVALTIMQLFNFAVIRSDGFAVKSFKLEA